MTVLDSSLCSVSPPLEGISPVFDFDVTSACAAGATWIMVEVSTLPVGARILFQPRAQAASPCSLSMPSAV